ncbi:JAB domain-containing protein [Dyadobacter sp. CY345]|uniref:JAB domain-containing protein n=1 Tax=Dyadobacter sp. CY345 TaxID=2909335 RepID=UPI001F3B9F8B|nr:JAB domain-containing protein [Dyadobacter sp. CY345]MCF2443300.1 JAB domain-containing protein [Dyadobacter sp. CY345]
MESANNVSNLYQFAEVELIYKSHVKASQRPKISGYYDVYRILLQSWDENKIGFVEQFKILLLDRANKVLGIYEVCQGGTSGVVVDVKLIFAAALKANAHGIILAHNHPSGNLTASEADRLITRRLKSAGEIMEIPVLDHLIITSEGYYSFVEQGELP